VSVKPWKLRIDWICWNQRHRPGWEDSPVEVWLDIMDREPLLLREFSSPQRAIDWALRYITDRGCQPGVVHIPEDLEAAGYVYLHAGPPLPQ
jgi:hypothetical protein